MRTPLKTTALAPLLLLALCGFLQPSNSNSEIVSQGIQTIETAHFTISLPQEITLGYGYREAISLTLENKTAQNQTAAVQVKTVVNIFITGQTCAVGQESNLIAVGSFIVTPGQKQNQEIEIQSLRIGSYDLKFMVDAKEFNLKIHAKVSERSPGFLYRCWSESGEFFNKIFSDGSQELTQDARHEKAKDIIKEEIRAGKSKEEARRDVMKQLQANYSKIIYRKKPDWARAYQHKIDQHTEQYGFQYIDIEGLGWSTVEHQKDFYNWSIGDFMLDLSNKYYFAEPFVRIEGAPDWAANSQGPSGRYGFYDADNKYLMDKYEQYCTALAERYDGDGIDDAPGSPIVNYYILANEPTLVWFSVDFDREGYFVPSGGEGIDATRWFKEAMRQGGIPRANQKYIELFGDITFASIRRAAEAIHKANPQARVATHQFVPGKFGGPDMALFKYLLDKGIGKYIDAWGLHPGNAFNLLTLWQQNFGVSYTVEDAANQAPPFEPDGFASARGGLDRRGEVLPTVQPVADIIRANPYMGKLWRTLIDEPYSQSLEDLAELLDRYHLDLPVWVTESIMIGPLATNRRENLIAALHEYTITFHQKVDITTIASVIENNQVSGSTPVSYLPDPTARELLLDLDRAIGGAHPVEKLDCLWFVPGEDHYLDYKRTVYKLFNRGDEDIIAIWSNSGKQEILDFEVASGAKLSDIRMMKFDADGNPFRTETTLTQFPSELKVKPLKDFYYLSVRSDKPKFGWLKNIQRRISPEEAEAYAQYQQTMDDLHSARGSLRSNARQDRQGLRQLVDQALERADNAIMMGDYATARTTLEELQRKLQK